MITRSQVKYIQSLSEKKFRKEAGCFIAEGPKIINEFLANSDPELVSLFATASWIAEAKKSALPFDQSKLLAIGESELKSISFLTTPNQVLGLFHLGTAPMKQDYHGKISLLLDGIQDPGNLGTIIRIADWYGIEHIVAGPNCADAYNPKVVQASMGSISRVKILYEDLEEFISVHNDIPVYAATLEGTSVPRVEEGFLLIGNESRGVNAKLIQSANYQVTIPRFGKAESLNAAVATGIILSAMRSD
ncbi:MAG: RNA methyltransferase [Chitinophagaceae bacterium]